MNRHTTDDARFLYLLERWLNGAFDRADERELHALTETDPFRQEAWEGFSALPESDHAAQLHQIRRRLQAKRSSRRVPFSVWMSAAAALALVVAAVYFWPKAGHKDLVQTTQPVENAPTDIQDDLAAAPDPGEAPGATATRPTAPPQEPSARRSEQSGPVPEYRQPEQDDFAADMANEEEKPADESTATAGEPEAARSKEVVRQAPPAQPQGTAGVPAFNTASDKVAATEAAKPAAPATTAPMKKKADSAFASEPPKPLLSSPAATPNGGWDNFQDFLRRNARLPEAARNNNVSGSVRLQFTVGPDGKPANVQFLQKLGFGCDEEAERLVRSFDWAPPGNAPVVVVVPFRR